jgi:hypothetical protein
MKTLLRMFAFVALALPVLAADTVKDPTDFASKIAVANKFEIDTVSSRMALRTLNAAAKTSVYCAPSALGSCGSLSERAFDIWLSQSQYSQFCYTREPL